LEFGLGLGLAIVLLPISAAMGRILYNVLLEIGRYKWSTLLADFYRSYAIGLSIV